MKAQSRLCWGGMAMLCGWPAALWAQTAPTAEEILKGIAARYSNLRTVHVISTTDIQPPLPHVKAGTSRLEIALESPDKFRFAGSGPIITGSDMMSVSDGRTTWSHRKGDGKYLVTPRAAAKSGGGQAVAKLDDLRHPDAVVAYWDENLFETFRTPLEQQRTARMSGAERLTVRPGNSVDCHLIEITKGSLAGNRAGGEKETWWVEKGKHIVWKQAGSVFLGDGVERRITITYSVVSLNEPLPEGTFRFVPPPGTTALEQP